MVRFIFKWTFRLLLLGFVMTVLLAVVFVLALDPVLRLVAEHNIRANTGMEAEIGQFHVGLLEPEITIRDLKIYNAPDFGGAPLLDIPEVHVEYDRAALQHRELHIKLLRFNLAELDIVKNETGQTNLFALALVRPPAQATLSSAAEADPGRELLRRTGLKFQQIDLLNVSIGKFQYLDLKNPRNNRQQVVGLESIPVRNVKSMADLAGLVVLLTMRSGDFFTRLVLPPGHH